ncbi:fungal-specific transcription factor domain-domain-containing protein [Kockovaella imperatae]|uniref:Fungal-specific transcription factor domain-domain-containing protein n=1 Tax=Kockovaella imperatae TaxID=4999 RepID=A0A1Y1UT79_9TREE|nr:fungal-specific transcription factor domain-domain-containing protein [Kockovaella imperatae]ORX41220.1 fungal-specific transcription factor domain-domain-containing protein [Kockovaella imperatae]
MRCREKKTRCPGNQPVCKPCEKAGSICEWPLKRRKKRTRKQIEADKQWMAAGHALTELPKTTLGSQTLFPNGPSAPSSSVSQDAAVALGFNLGWLDVWNATLGGHPPSMTPANGMLPPQHQHDLGIGSSTSTRPSFGSQDFMNPSQSETMAGVHAPMDPRLINAVQRQAAFIEGDPSEDDDLELFYYHFSGPTSIRPGLNRISLKLQRRVPHSSHGGHSERSVHESPSDLSSTPFSLPQHIPEDLWDPSGMPLPHIRDPLLELFFQHCSQFFPSLSRQRVKERIETETLSAFLTNCACALGARFAQPPISTILVRTHERAKSPLNATSTSTGPVGSAASAPFVSKAQELIVPLLHLPTHDVCTGLLYLAWASYGLNSEAGFWQFSGMAFRMAIDLGIHEDSTIYESVAHVTRTRLLFWNLFMTDRIISFVTGRAASIADDVVEIPLPEDDYMFPDPARNTSEYLETNPSAILSEPAPYVQFVKLMVICGRISDLLNGRRGRSRTLVNKVENLVERLGQLQVELVHFISALPPTLQWLADNFRHHASKSHGGIYLALHLWANAVVAFVYHPELLQSPHGAETPLTQNMARNRSLSLASSRQICECMVFADLVEHATYTSNPFIVQPLFVAAMTFILEMRTASSQDQPPSPEPFPRHSEDALLSSMTKQNLSVILNALGRMELYWSGIGPVLSLLEQRSGVTASRPRGNKGVPFISLPDQGVLRRFKTDRHHPHNVAPADDRSLQDSIVRSGSLIDQNPVALADFMAGYSVEGMSFGPADDLDLERLLAQP